MVERGKIPLKFPLTQVIVYGIIESYIKKIKGVVGWS